MWALVKNGDVVEKAAVPTPTTSNKREMIHYRWIEITEDTGDCDIGDAFLNGKFLGPVTYAGARPSDFHYYKYTERELASATTNREYFEFLSLTTDTLEEGSYRFAWVYDWSSEKNKAVFNAKLEHHKVGQSVIEVFKHEPPNKHIKSESINSVSGFKPMTLSGVNEFKLYYKSNGHQESVSIWNARLEILRLS